jgi:hypothetical protein
MDSLFFHFMIQYEGTLNYNIILYEGTLNYIVKFKVCYSLEFITDVP